MDERTQGQSNTDTSLGQVPRGPLRSAFHGTFDGLWLVAPDGRTTYADAAMAGLLGLTPNEMRGRLIADFVADARWVEFELFLARLRTHAGEHVEVRFRRDDGTDLLGVVAGSPITTHEGAYVGALLSVSDVAGQRVIDAQIVQNQRLEAIGQFTGGIVHDFNNLLTAIRGHAELARAKLPDGDAIRKDLDQVLASAERAGAVTRRLLAFTSPQVPIPVDVDPAEVIADLVALLGPLMGDDVDVTLDVEADHGWIRVDPTQLEQVIVNLVVNARDAMPTGGTVTIAVHDTTSADPDRPDALFGAGPFVRISVSDTGAGMDEATRARIFDPFFTTKSQGKGAGLGLATVFGIVTQAGGNIEVDSAPGRGSSFHVDLPRVDAAGLPGPQFLAQPAPRPTVVLLVEDDHAVREFARRGLESVGCTVLTAAGSDEALAESKRWVGGIDVLVTELALSGVHGPELAVRIRAQRPSIGVVFTSGYAVDALGRGAGLSVPGVFLPKPFSLDSLSRAVGRAADIGRGGTPEQ
jgi:two-component system cell cycle sensor histidine kinase/response regulator CckA